MRLIKLDKTQPPPQPPPEVTSVTIELTGAEVVFLEYMIGRTHTSLTSKCFNVELRNIYDIFYKIVRDNRDLDTASKESIKTLKASGEKLFIG